MKSSDSIAWAVRINTSWYGIDDRVVAGWPNRDMFYRRSNALVHVRDMRSRGYEDVRLVRITRVRYVKCTDSACWGGLHTRDSACHGTGKVRVREAA